MSDVKSYELLTDPDMVSGCDRYVVAHAMQQAVAEIARLQNLMRAFGVADIELDETEEWGPHGKCACHHVATYNALKDECRKIATADRSTT
jgi:hypothetical protein